MPLEQLDCAKQIVQRVCQTDSLACDSLSAKTSEFATKHEKSTENNSKSLYPITERELRSYLFNFPNGAFRDQVLYNISLHFDRIGKTDSTKKYLTELIESCPLSSKTQIAHFRIGEIHYERMKCIEALDSYKRIDYDQLPKNLDFLRLFALIHSANCLIETKDSVRAIEKYFKAKSLIKASSFSPEFNAQKILKSDFEFYLGVNIGKIDSIYEANQKAAN